VIGLRLQFQSGLEMLCASEDWARIDHGHRIVVVLSQALDIDGAHEHLKRAIDLEPRNRISARQDADFAAFSSQPQIQQLLFPDKTGAA